MRIAPARRREPQLTALTRTLRSLLARVLGAFLLFISAGCASLVNQNYKMVPVGSDPTGATVFYLGVAVGVTPCTVAVRGKESTVVEVRRDGYHTQVCDLDWHINPWFFGNFVSWGITGFVFDLATGYHIDVDDQPVAVSLVPLDRPHVPWVRKDKPPALPDDAMSEEERMKIPIWRRPPRYTDK